MFVDEMEEMRSKLERLGHEVEFPSGETTDGNGGMIHAKEYYVLCKTTNTTDGWIWEKREELMKGHLNKVMWADAVLILNLNKNGTAYYIGGNTLMEMGLAFHQGKKIFLLNPIPEISYKEEILGMRPTVINEDLNLIV